MGGGEGVLKPYRHMWLKLLRSISLALELNVSQEKDGVEWE